MREKSRLVIGIDQTWAVSDRALDGDLEVKYTVDPVGTELLLYRDATAPHILAKDRSAVFRSRLLAALPAAVRRRIVGLRHRVPHIRMVVREWLHRRRARHGGARRENLVPVGPALAPYLAAPVTEHDSLTEEHWQRQQVLTLLREHGIEAAVLPAGRGKRAVVVIRDDDRERAVRMLARTLRRPWYVVPLDTPLVRPRRLTARRLQRLCGQSDGFRVFRYLAAGPGRVLAGAALGCDIEVWRYPRPNLLGHPAPPREHAGTLVAPRRNIWATRLGPDTWIDAGARNGHIVDVGSLPHIFDVIGPIDVVYTWVDDTDPAWLAAKNATARARGRSTTGDDDARFRSHDELRYSLRSVEMYASWVRTIHIVTAGQQPAWLNVDHPRIRLVDHREIFADPSVLPVFNSHAIESQLHRIPGLAERYLYLNDDVFLGRPATKDLFFHGNGLAKFFLSTALVGLGPRTEYDNAHTQAAKNNRTVLGEMLGRTVTHQFQHAPHPQLRSVLEDLEAARPDIFAAVSRSAFRSPTDVSIASALHHYYAYSTGRAVPGRLEYLYLDLNHPGASQRLERLLRTREFDVYCINDTPAAGHRIERQSRVLREFLERYYPLPSSFEVPHTQHAAGLGR